MVQQKRRDIRMAPSASYSPPIPSLTGPIIPHVPTATEILRGVSYGGEIMVMDGELNITAISHHVKAQGGAPYDDVTRINGMSGGRLLMLLAAEDSATITFKHNAAGGNIRIPGEADAVLNGVENTLFFIGDAAQSTWVLVRPILASEHARAHEMVGTNDHKAEPLMSFYTDEYGDVQELPLGEEGSVCVSTGEEEEPVVQRRLEFADLDAPFDDLKSDPADTTTAAADGAEKTPARKDHAHKLHDHDHTGDVGDGGAVSDTYQVVSEKDGASGYCGLDANSRVDPTQTAESPKSIPIEDPVATDNFTLGFFDKAITITQLNDVIQGTTSVTWNIKHATTRDSGSPNSLFTSDRTTSSTSGAETSTFADATIPAGSWVWYVASAIVGTPDELNITIHFTFD